MKRTLRVSLVYLAVVVAGMSAGLLIDHLDPCGIHKRSVRERSPWAMPDDVANALRTAETMELWSLDPTQKVLDPDAFHHWKAYGKVRVESADDRKAVAELLIQDGMGGPAFLCFEPRHGVRLSGSAGTVDLLICFECGIAEVYGLGEKRSYLTSSFTQPLLNRLLAAGDMSPTPPPATTPPTGAGSAPRSGNP